MFTLCDSNWNKGFHITFDNGWTVSVQWGRSNYCDNKTYDNDTVISNSCPNAEVWAWNNKRNFEQPVVWLTPIEVLDYINKVAAFPKED